MKVRTEVRALQLRDRPHLRSTYFGSPCNGDLHIMDSFRSRFNDRGKIVRNVVYSTSIARQYKQ